MQIVFLYGINNVYNKPLLFQSQCCGADGPHDFETSAWLVNGSHVSDLTHGPLTRYVKLRVAHAPGMPGMLSPPRRVSDPGMHRGTCGTHVP